MTISGIPLFLAQALISLCFCLEVEADRGIVLTKLWPSAEDSELSASSASLPLGVLHAQELEVSDEAEASTFNADSDSSVPKVRKAKVLGPRVRPKSSSGSTTPSGPQVAPFQFVYPAQVLPASVSFERERMFETQVETQVEKVQHPLNQAFPPEIRPVAVSPEVETNVEKSPHPLNQALSSEIRAALASPEVETNVEKGQHPLNQTLPTEIRAALVSPEVETNVAKSQHPLNQALPTEIRATPVSPEVETKIEKSQHPLNQAFPPQIVRARVSPETERLLETKVESVQHPLRQALPPQLPAAPVSRKAERLSETKVEKVHQPLYKASVPLVVVTAAPVPSAPIASPRKAFPVVPRVPHNERQAKVQQPAARPVAPQVAVAAFARAVALAPPVKAQVPARQDSKALKLEQKARKMDKNDPTKVLDRVHTIIIDQVELAGRGIENFKTTWAERVVKYVYNSAQREELQLVPFEEACDELVNLAMGSYESACGDMKWVVELDLAPTFAAVAWELLRDKRGLSFEQVQARTKAAFEEYLDLIKLNKGMWEAASKTFRSLAVHSKVYAAVQKGHRVALDAIMMEVTPGQEVEQVQEFLKLWISDTMTRAWSSVPNAERILTPTSVSKLFQNMLLPFGPDDSFTTIPSVFTKRIGPPPRNWSFVNNEVEALFTSWRQNGKSRGSQRQVSEKKRL